MYVDGVGLHFSFVFFEVEIGSIFFLLQENFEINPIGFKKLVLSSNYLQFIPIFLYVAELR